MYPVWSVQAKVDAEVAAKAARNFEEKHGLLGKDRPSSGQIGRKSAAKENAQPSKAVKPLKETAADAKGKGTHLLRRFTANSLACRPVYRTPFWG